MESLSKLIAENKATIMLRKSLILFTVLKGLSTLKERKALKSVVLYPASTFDT